MILIADSRLECTLQSNSWACVECNELLMGGNSDAHTQCQLSLYTRIAALHSHDHTPGRQPLILSTSSLKNRPKMCRLRRMHVL